MPAKVSALKAHASLILGVAASFAYGFWGFFEKLAGADDVLAINTVVYATAFVLSLSGLFRWKPPSIAAFTCGIAGGGINALILVALRQHPLILVYPFVSLGTIFFVLFTFFFLGGSFEIRSKPLLFSGIIVALLGTIVCSIGLVGGVGKIFNHSIDPTSVCVGLLISVLTGLWLFLAFLTITRDGYSPSIAATWVFLGSLSIAIFMAILIPPGLKWPSHTSTTAYGLLAGVFMFLGEYSTYHSFRAAPSADRRLEQAITAFLSNSELVPIFLLSWIVLGERTGEGIIGSAFVFAGVLMLNASRSQDSDASQ